MSGRPSALFTDAYDEAAPGFARSADRLVYTPLARPLVAAITAWLDADDGRVLDVAAGTGSFGRAFTNVVALDLAAQQLARNAAYRRVQADAQQLPFRRDSFAAAGCAFGINHLPQPHLLVNEMARVAPVTGVSTWRRPENPFAPKEIVHAAIERQVGRSRTPMGELLDRLSDTVGSVRAVDRLLGEAGLAGEVRSVHVEVPWPGADAYLDYRLSMPSTARPTNLARLRADVGERLADLPAEQLVWRPGIVIGVGRRSSRRSPPLVDQPSSEEPVPQVGRQPARHFFDAGPGE